MSQFVGFVREEAGGFQRWAAVGLGCGVVGMGLSVGGPVMLLRLLGSVEGQPRGLAILIGAVCAVALVGLVASLMGLERARGGEFWMGLLGVLLNVLAGLGFGLGLAALIFS